jgi:DNA polymerase III delta prime subunit
VVIKGIKLSLDKMKKHRELKAQAEELGYEQSVLDQIESQSERMMKSSIEDIETEVLQHFKKDGDTTELKTAIRLRINGMANRMERGFSFEVRTALPPQPTPDQAKMGKLVEALTTLRFEPIAGPRLLALPEAVEEPEEDKALKTKKKKTTT